jgi:putative SbcD/Mre11-related phosphoesterase
MRVLHDWLLTPERVAVHGPTRTAVVADLHLGYAEARRRRGDAVPSEAVNELLEPLRRVRQQHEVRRLVIAGDLLEDGDCREALAAFVEWVDGSGMDLLAVVPGNHDKDLASLGDAACRLPLRPEGVTVGGWRIVHGEGVLPDAPVVHGHDHPCLRWSPKSRANRPRFTRSRFAPNTIDGPCFLTGPRRLILPAFSKEAAGVNILSVPRWRALCCHIVAGDRVLDLGEVSSLRRRLVVADSI